MFLLCERAGNGDPSAVDVKLGFPRRMYSAASETHPSMRPTRPRDITNKNAPRSKVASALLQLRAQPKKEELLWWPPSMGSKRRPKSRKAMHERKHGTLRSGRSAKKVTSRKQAIAIGLSEARRSGAKVPKKKDGHGTKKGHAPRRALLASGRPGDGRARVPRPEAHLPPV